MGYTDTDRSAPTDVASSPYEVRPVPSRVVSCEFVSTFQPLHRREMDHAIASFVIGGHAAINVRDVVEAA